MTPVLLSIPLQVEGASMWRRGSVKAQYDVATAVHADN